MRRQEGGGSREKSDERDAERSAHCSDIDSQHLADSLVVEQRGK
jgi:hypothetical protein